MNSHVPRDAGSDAMLRFLDRIGSEGKKARDTWGKDWNRDVAIWRGRSNRTGAGDVTNQRANFHSDIITSAMSRRISLLGESKPTFDVLPRRPHLDASADILKVAVQGVLDSAQFPACNEIMLSLAAIMGAAGIRTRWQREPQFGFGEITLTAIDARRIGIDPEVSYAHEINEGQYVWIDTTQPTGLLQRRYPQFADRIKPDLSIPPDDDRGSSVWNLRSIFRGFSGSGESDAVPRTRVREFFIMDPSSDDGTPRYPNGRYIVRAGDDLVVNPDDDQNPYFDGLCDLDIFDNAFDPDHPWGRSEIEALRTMQNAFNDSGDLMVKAFTRNGMPWVIADRSALDPDTVQRLRDRGQYVIEKAGGRSVERTPGAAIGPDAIALMQLLLQLISQQTGLTDPGMEGNGRVEVRSGAQVEGLAQAAQVLIKASARRLEMTLERVGQKIVSRIIQFYDDDRMLTYYGGGETFIKYKFERQKLVAEIITYGVERAVKEARKRKEDPSVDTLADAMLLSIKQAWRDFQFRIVPYSSLSSVKTQRAMLKLQLAQGGLIRASTALREIGIENPEEEWQEAAKEAKMRQDLGLTPPPKKGK